MKVFGLAFWLEMGRGFATVSKRFPLAVLSGFGCALTFSVLIDQNNDNETLIRLGVTLGFGISLFILTELLSDLLGGKTSPRSIAVSLGAIGFLVLLYRWIPVEDSDDFLNVFWIRFLMLGVLVHFAISVVPFWNLKDRDVSLWEYNKLLFTRFLLSGFFSAVFCLGTILALVSIDKLFGVDVDEENYGRIWFFCAFVLNTYLFLGGMVSASEKPGLILDYPKWIHFFSKFILLPLVIVYFAILFAYSFKIVITWSWPDGMVGLPVFILAVIGGLTGLLIWPLSQVEPITKWAKSFWRLFFPLFVPLSVLLLLAMHRRISDYGFTEIRYMGLILGYWILALSIFFSVKPSASFKFIPWSLIAIFIVFSIGPISPAKVALKSQWKRLDTILQKEGLLVEDTLVANPKEVQNEIYYDLRSIVKYLRDGYGSDIFEPLIKNIKPKDRQDKTGKDWLELRRRQFTSAFMDYTGINAMNVRERNALNIRLIDELPIEVEAHSLVYSVRMLSRENESFAEFTAFGETVSMARSEKPSVIEFRDRSEQMLAEFDFTGWVEKQVAESRSGSRSEIPMMDPKDINFKIELVSLGQVQLVGKNIRLHKRDNEWVMGICEFLLIVPAD